MLTDSPWRMALKLYFESNELRYTMPHELAAQFAPSSSSSDDADDPDESPISYLFISLTKVYSAFLSAFQRASTISLVLISPRRMFHVVMVSH
jgi:hypothetical protein